jgi:hypothetical protein
MMKEDPRVHFFTPAEKALDAEAGAREILEGHRAELKKVIEEDIPMIEEQLRRAKDPATRDINAAFDLQERLKALMKKKAELLVKIEKWVQAFEDTDTDQKTPTLH